MCEANAYWLRDGRESLLMESVDVVEQADPGEWRLVNIFGEQKMVKARIARLALGSHRLLFAPPE